MLVSHLEHIADEWKNVNMLLQIETNFITYVTCIHVEGPAHLGIIKSTLFELTLQIHKLTWVHIRHKVSFYLERLK